MAFLTPATLPFRSVTTHRSTCRARRTRMIATEPLKTATDDKSPPSQTTATKLSPQAEQLLSYVRGHKSIFLPGRGFTAATLALFRKCDTSHCFTPLEEISVNAHVLPGGSVAGLILVHLEDLIAVAENAARQSFAPLKTDSVLQEIFTHDITNVLRVISYGVATQSPDFVNHENVSILKMFHKEVGFPAGLVSNALAELKDSLLERVTDEKIATNTSECFDVLINSL